MSLLSSPGRDAGGGDPLDRLRQPRAALLADGLELARAMDLLGDVGQVEVGREGADQACGGHRVDLGEDRGGGVAILAHEPAHALDEVKDVAALLAHERVAEQHAQLADVAAQGGLGGLAGGGALVGQHRCCAW
jgi:hypothetical protein